MFDGVGLKGRGPGDDDLSNATRKAPRHMIDFLGAEKGLSRDEAYMLISVAGDVEITELVDHNKGVHVKLAKALFTRETASGPPAAP